MKNTGKVSQVGLLYILETQGPNVLKTMTKDRDQR